MQFSDLKNSTCPVCGAPGKKTDVVAEYDCGRVYTRLASGYCTSNDPPGCSRRRISGIKVTPKPVDLDKLQVSIDAAAESGVRMNIYLGKGPDPNCWPVSLRTDQMQWLLNKAREAQHLQGPDLLRELPEVKEDR